MGKDTDHEGGLTTTGRLIVGASIILGGVSEAACNPPTPPSETAPVPSNTVKSPVDTLTSDPTDNIHLFTPTVSPTLQTITPQEAATSEETAVMPTPTEKSIDYSPAFFDPQNEADFSKVIDSPSPIDDPTDFAKWQDGYLAAVNAKLQNYTGPVIEDIGIDYQDSVVYANTNGLLPAFSSYKYSYQDETIVVKTYILKDRNGDLIPFSMTILPDGLSQLLKDPAGKKMSMGLFYNQPAKGNIFGGSSFVKSLFAASPDNGKVSDSLRLILQGKSTAEDREQFSKAIFLYVDLE